MSAPNGGNAPNMEETFFTSTQPPFPEPNQDSKLDTLQFLDAARGVVALVDLFGKTFAPVKMDMNGNVEKLTKQYEKDPKKHSTLHDMIIAEKEKGEDFATDALLWLKRGLHFFEVFLQCVLQDALDEKHSEHLAPFLRQAYTTTLEMYHGWMAKQLFGLLCRICPNRKDLLTAMSLGHENREAAVFRDLAPFIASLRRTVEVVDELYRAQGLNLEVRA